jgi:uncharacterized protein (DUF433 family)
LAYVVVHPEAKMATSAPKQPLTFRVAPATRRHLKRRAVESGESQTALAERYVEEGLRRDEHPLIWFRDGAAGRRAALLGTRLDVWQVIETLRQAGNSIEDAAAYLDQPVVRIRAALRYYAEYRDEVDAWAERMHAIAEREEAAWAGEREILS